MEWTTEYLFTSPECFGVTKATPLQRAIARAIDGRPLEELWDLDVVRRAFGNAKPPEGVTPAKIVIVASIWSGKTLFAAAKAIVSSQIVDTRDLIASDEVRAARSASARAWSSQCAVMGPWRMPSEAR